MPGAESAEQIALAPCDLVPPAAWPIQRRIRFLRRSGLRCAQCSGRDANTIVNGLWDVGEPVHVLCRPWNTPPNRDGHLVWSMAAKGSQTRLRPAAHYRGVGVQSNPPSTSAKIF